MLGNTPPEFMRIEYPKRIAELEKEKDKLALPVLFFSFVFIFILFVGINEDMYYFLAYEKGLSHGAIVLLHDFALYGSFILWMLGLYRRRKFSREISIYSKALYELDITN